MKAADTKFIIITMVITITTSTTITISAIEVLAAITKDMDLIALAIASLVWVEVK